MADYQANDKSYVETSPPKAVDVLAGIFEKQRKQSNHIPLRPFDAAYWWIDHQEPPNENTERMTRDTVKGGNGAWKAPYIDRVAGTLRIFLRLNEPQKAFVIQQIENGTPWRGDEIAFYKSVIAETEKFKANPEEYKKIGGKVLAGMHR